VISELSPLRGIVLAAGVAMGLPAIAASGAMAESVTECIPAKAGAPVVAGTASGECKASKTTTYTPVALPASAAEQQKLLAMLPYIQYEASGIAGKPTITFTGVNIHLLAGAEMTGTGNLVIGEQGNPGHGACLLIPPNSGVTGTENLVIGSRNAASGWGSLVSGTCNADGGEDSGMIGGEYNSASTESGDGAVVAGYQDQVSGGGAIIGGWRNSADEDATVTGGVENSAVGTWASVGGGQLNRALGAKAFVGGGYKNTAAGTYSSILGGKLTEATKEYEAKL